MKTTFKQSTLFINQHVITNAINNSKTDMIVWLIRMFATQLLYSRFTQVVLNTVSAYLHDRVSLFVIHLTTLYLVIMDGDAPCIECTKIKYK